MIKITQPQVITLYIEGAEFRLADEEASLAKAKDLVAKAYNSGSAMSAAYISTRDETRYFLDEIATLRNVATLSQKRLARLVTPIYSSDIPIAPKKQLTLVIRLFSGLFLALLIALVWAMIAKSTGEVGGIFHDGYPVKIANEAQRNQVQEVIF